MPSSCQFPHFQHDFNSNILLFLSCHILQTMVPNMIFTSIAKSLEDFYVLSVLFPLVDIVTPWWCFKLQYKGLQYEWWIRTLEKGMIPISGSSSQSTHIGSTCIPNWKNLSCFKSMLHNSKEKTAYFGSICRDLNHIVPFNNMRRSPSALQVE